MTGPLGLVCPITCSRPLANRMSCPVIFAARSLSRYVTSGAIVSGGPLGTALLSAAAILVHAIGHTALTRIPLSWSSLAAPAVMLATAPLDALYVSALGCPTIATEPRLT